MDVIRAYEQAWDQSGLKPDQFTMLTRRGNSVRVLVNERDLFDNVVDFSSNDILGLACDARLASAAKAAIDEWGTSSSCSPALLGSTQLHRKLEREVSALKQLPYTYLFVNAWMGISAFVDSFCHLNMRLEGFTNESPVLILSDVLNHGCIRNACFRAQTRIGGRRVSANPIKTVEYRHCDSQDLATKLKAEWTEGLRVLLITDSVFSMDGDIAPLPEYIELLSQFPNTTLLVDEAHATGAIGSRGHGIYDHFDITPSNLISRGVSPVILSTFSKFAGSAGCAISTHEHALIDLFHLNPAGALTIALPPPSVAAALEAYRILVASPYLPKKLQANAVRLRQLLTEAGFSCGGETQVIPITCHNGQYAKEFVRRLLGEGFMIGGVWYVAAARFRIVANVLHEDEEMQKLVAAMCRVRESMK